MGPQESERKPRTNLKKAEFKWAAADDWTHQAVDAIREERHLVKTEMAKRKGGLDDASGPVGTAAACCCVAVLLMTMSLCRHVWVVVAGKSVKTRKRAAAEQDLSAWNRRRSSALLYPDDLEELAGTGPGTPDPSVRSGVCALQRGPLWLDPLGADLVQRSG